MITGAITDVTVSGSEVQINLSATALANYIDDELHINYVDADNDQDAASGALQASNGGADVASFTKSFTYTTTAATGGGEEGTFTG